MRSVSNGQLSKAVILSFLMILMTQAGFLDTLNVWTNDEETLDQSTDVLETGGSGASNFTASVEGADLIIDEAMTNITFQYNASAASGSAAAQAAAQAPQPTATEQHGRWLTSSAVVPVVTPDITWRS